MNSIPQNARSEHILRLHPGALTPERIVDQVADHIQSQYEGRVIALVVHDLAAVVPAAGESTVMALVADVWAQAQQHVRAADTTWTHISWFVGDAIARFAEKLRPQMAGC
ncbi:hypothetical protein [Kitasatospora sp. NPDC092286]|uniref:hypothetical protein n=1 Tax=Kitasatospora sp. NPDC092286 TaxID=3364087 RepID=UPI003830B57A